MINKNTTLKELALIVCKRLKEFNIDAVLTGGAVVSIYTQNKYESYDLDFITHSNLKEIEKALLTLNFVKSDNRYFINPETSFIIEFPAPPIAIGNKPVNQFNELNENNGYLKLLTPTDCVMDRLAGFYHWDDLQCLEQAVLVASTQKVDLKKVKQWSSSEGMAEKYEVFLKKFKLYNTDKKSKG